MGLSPTVTALSLPWNASLASTVAAGLGRSWGGFAGCCSPSLWCSASACVSNAPGASYVNYGWTHDSSLSPVYTCSNSSAAAGAGAEGAAPQLGSVSRVTPQAVTAPSTAVVLEGTGLGNSSADVLVQIGDDFCTGVTMCHRMCSLCRLSSDCGGMTCVQFEGQANGACVPQCGPTGSCPCGAVCIAVSGSQSGVCVNSDYGGAGPCNATSAAAQFQPAPASLYL